MNLKLSIIGAALFGAISCQAQGETITFDNIAASGTGALIPNGYQGLNWYLSVLNVPHFTSSGGTIAGYGGSGNEFVMDNLVVDDVAPTVPLPATAWLMLAGIAGLLPFAFASRRNGRVLP